MASPGAELYQKVSGSSALPTYTPAASTATDGASLYHAVTPKTQEVDAAPEHHGSLFGNLLSDAGSAVHGIVPGIEATASAIGHDVKVSAEHPLRNSGIYQHATGGKAPKSAVVEKVVKPIAKQEAQEWGPLVHGDVGEFYKRFHEHPLGPVLDALTVLTAGGSRAAALGMLPEDAKASDALRAAATGKYQGPLKEIKVSAGGKEVAARTIPRNGARAARMIATDKALKALPPNTRVIGEFARAARAVKAEHLPTELRHLADDRYTDYLKKFSGLSKNQRVAQALLNRLPLPEDLARWKASLEGSADPSARSMLKVLNNRYVLSEYLNPSRKVLDAHEAQKKLANAREEILHKTGAADISDLADTPYRHMGFVRGDLDAAKFRDEIQSAGRPTPHYIPDQPNPPKLVSLGTGRGKKHLSPERVKADLHASEGILFRTGQLALHPDVMGPSFLRAARHDHYQDIADHVRSLAEPHAWLPEGYEWVRKTRGQRIPYTLTTKGAHVHEVDRQFPDTSEIDAPDPETQREKPTLSIPGVEGKPPSSKIAQDVERTSDGRYLAVPSQFSHSLSGDFRKSSAAMERWVGQPLAVWRKLILNARIPWLENNVLGNALLTTVRFGGINGLQTALGMIRTTKGVEAAASALKWAEQNGHLSAADVQELLPELSKSGTFIGTQLPTGVLANAPNFVQKAAKVPGAAFGVLPAIDRATEGAFRRGAAETVLRKSHEVKARMAAMPKETRSFRAAARQALQEDPALRRLVVREVNDALGDFLHMSHAEQTYIRNAIPFYAWFREITRIALKLPLDAPGRADIIAKIGQIGAQQQNSTLGPLPSYLQGSVALGVPGATQNILALNGANPYESTVQTLSALGVLAGVHPTRQGSDQLESSLNPFVAAALTLLPSATRGEAPKGGYGKALWNSVGATLPEVRIGTNPPSRLYPGRTRQDLLEQFFGSPVRKISPQQAHYDAARGQ